MPTNIWGVAFYVFALFPGVAFLFAREGHRPTAKRSVLRETASVVLVSAVCAALLAVPFALLSLLWPSFNTEVMRLMSGDLAWVRNNLSASIGLSIVILAGATCLGYALGTKWMDEHGLEKLWKSSIPRDTSAWMAMFSAAEGQAVDVALTLKSGAWVSGTLYTFDNDPDPHPHRVVTLTQPFYRPPGAEDAVALMETDFLMIEAGEIELIQTSIKVVDPELTMTGPELITPEGSPSADSTS